jgi:hypothetical protein
MAQVDSENNTAMPRETAGPLYIPTNVSPEELFQAIGRLRKEARDEIDRLIRFLDDTDNHMEREEAVDDVGCDDIEVEPSLGWTELEARFGRHAAPADVDAELDNCDDEPSLGSDDCAIYNQRGWAAGGTTDCEGDEHDGREPQEDDEWDDTGIGDPDGLQEQIGRTPGFQYQEVL